VVVCTRDRPIELGRCLQSIAAARAGGAEVAEVVVGDDGTEAGGAPAADVVATVVGLPPCRVLDGPRAGLAANRNACVDVVEGELVLFLDDDATLTAELVHAALAEAGPDRIVTGFEWRGAERVEPQDPDFLGYLRRPRAEPLSTLVVNAAVFPTAFLRQHGFDEFFRFGSEEIEIALLARQVGLTLRYVDVANHHLQAEGGRTGNEIEGLRSKGYFGARRYRSYQPSRGRAAAFVVVGTLSAFRGGLRQPPRLSHGRTFATAFLDGVRHGRHPGPRRQPSRSASP
jgi:glycosyltransferase involved in cell wall biosynthesis